jgi:hypothetical protein
VTEIEAIECSDPWLSLRTGPSPTFASAERLICALQAHASAEAHDLADCEDLARRSDEPSVKLLLGLIVEDEYRHQVLLNSMLRRLPRGSQIAHIRAAPTVEVDAPLSEVEFAAALRTLIRDAHEGARHLRHIGRQETSVYGGLYTLLLEGIARDSEKHAAILRFLLLRVERGSTC